jgi:hypothetical protein
MVSAPAAPVPSRAIHIGDIWPHERAIWVLLAGQAGGLVTQVLAVCIARQGVDTAAALISICGFGLAFAGALWSLTRPQLTRVLRNAAVACIGLTPTVLWWMGSPLMFRQFDEPLHMRTLSDIVSSHRLFSPHPLLAVSSRYPGLEAVTALLHQLGLPVMVAAMVVVLVARLALVVVLCDAVEHLTGSPRAGGFAVAVYAMSSQFVSFNSQFAYQTLALPFALGAVAFIARARWAADPRPLFGGATVCLLAVAVTHHITSWFTVAFLVLWATAERDRQARRRVFSSAAIAAVTTTVWAMIQFSLLREYFLPVIDDLHSQVNGNWRGAFSDSAGYKTPEWERVFLVYYTGALTLVVAFLLFVWARSELPRPRSRAPRCDARRWQPRVLLMVLVAMNPVLTAARVLPIGSQIADRLSTFLFLALSLLVARTADRWSRLRRASNSPSWSHAQLVIIRSVALVLVTGAYIGGYLMGSGPEWIRMPGPYLVGADNRSMDAETVAAVRWARDSLPAGRLVGADRVSSVLLASEAELWPVMHDKDWALPPVYFADDWDESRAGVVRGLHLRYLYVDRRWANELPHLAVYFYRGERGEQASGSEHELLTRDELTKFDDVPGIRTAYRHGPISIYDLGGLYDESGVNPDYYRNGWFGVKAPAIGVPFQIAIGLLLGLALALVARSKAGYIVTERVKSFKISAGPSLTFTGVLATFCVASITLLLVHIWLGPIGFLSMALAVLLVNRRRIKLHFHATFLLINARLDRRRWVAALAMLAVVVAAIVQSILVAYSEDVTKVQSILDDPSAVHMPVDNPAGNADGTQ